MHLRFWQQHLRFWQRHSRFWQRHLRYYDFLSQKHFSRYAHRLTQIWFIVYYIQKPGQSMFTRHINNHYWQYHCTMYLAVYLMYYIVLHVKSNNYINIKRKLHLILIIGNTFVHSYILGCIYVHCTN